MVWQVLQSEQDASVNFTRETEDGGMVECRFVRREPCYAIAYLSSHTGCKHACRFCHLTQTRQTTFTPVSTAGLLDQLDCVLAHLDTQPPAQRLHINFMARGDALSSRVVTEDFAAFAGPATAAIRARGMEPRFNISSIFPRDGAGVDLVEAFGGWPVIFFWSLYSRNPQFRKRWIPRGQAPEAVLDKLLAWQAATGREVVLHWAFIAGENDDPAELAATRDWLKQSGLVARFNLVRYNPFSTRQGRETEAAHLEALFDSLAPAMRAPGSRIVPRVGFDVAASCGMFVQPAA